MKILFVSLLLPHPYADHASAFTVFKTIKHLSKKHTISLISFTRSEKEREYVRFIKPYCENVETVVLPQNSLRRFWVRTNLLTLTPITVSQSYSREMQEKIHFMVSESEYDIVQMEYTPTGQYISAVKNTATVINVHDMLTVSAERLVKNLKFSRKKVEWFIDSLIGRGYESRLYRKFDKVITLSQKIKEHLQDCDPSLKITVIPTGVDIPEVQKTYTIEKGKNLIFMGAMWRDENIDAVLYFYHSAFNLIRKAMPEVTLTVMGGSPSEEIKSLACDSGIRITGYVEDFLPYYLKSDVSVAPMRIGGGVQCKILDAMAAGLPVITTSQGNGGIGAREEEQRTVELLQNGHQRKAMGQRGMDFVRRNFDWNQIIKRLETVYEECIAFS
jgi:glycosyltransferase involved in cell wall biosynthesis